MLLQDIILLVPFCLQLPVRSYGDGQLDPAVGEDIRHRIEVVRTLRPPSRARARARALTGRQQQHRSHHPFPGTVLAAIVIPQLKVQTSHLELTLPPLLLRGSAQRGWERRLYVLDGDCQGSAVGQHVLPDLVAVAAACTPHQAAVSIDIAIAIGVAVEQGLYDYLLVPTLAVCPALVHGTQHPNLKQHVRHTVSINSGHLQEDVIL